MKFQLALTRDAAANSDAAAHVVHFTVSNPIVHNTMATEALCGGAVTSQRGLLAFLWSLLNILSAVAFLSALIFTISVKKDDDEDDYYNSNNADERNEEQDDMEPVIALTSRAMAFAALWTAVMATLLAIFGTVVLGWQSPTGQYYTCCSPQVHRTTPIALGSFIGALLMYANLTLVCSVLFGEFEIRDYREGEERAREEQYERSTAVSRSSMAFSVMCMFLTVLYAGFAALTFAFSRTVLEELDEDERLDALGSTRSKSTHFAAGTTYKNGYIGERFDVRGRGSTPGFVTPTPQEGSLT